jgi:hypothetical protein
MKASDLLTHQFTRTDAQIVLDELIDEVLIPHLRKDPTIPRSSAEWDLKLAAAYDDAVETLFYRLMAYHQVSIAFFDLVEDDL